MTFRKFLKRESSHILTSTLVWTALMLMFVLVRFYGIDEEILVQSSGDQQEVATLILIQGLMLGVFLGLAFSILDTMIDRRVMHWVSYIHLVLFRTIGHVIVTLPILGITSFLTHKWLGYVDHASWEDLFLASPFLKSATVLLLYTGVMSILMNILRQIGSMFGPGIMFKLITGRYHRPVEEERIFLFLDLKSSTQYAEQLGHMLYSELIQDCFFDLTPAIQKHKAEVYQYVGDEAVLTWPMSLGLEKNHCIHAYFEYMRAIQKRAGYYQEKYGFVPVFKAGANCGPVMAAEVGIVKREIAYHSDVLNTAARIQSRCNELGQPLLISEFLRDRLPADPGFTTVDAGTFQLRGKRTSITIFGVQSRLPEFVTDSISA